MNESRLGNLLTTGLLVAAAFVIGMLFTEVRYLKKGVGTTTTQPTADANAPAPAEEADLTAVRPVDDTDHIRGNKDAPITLIEYSDFECPFCAAFHPTVNQILEDYGDQVRLVYRHYPLSFHPQAQKAGEGSECAAKLGGNDAFWKYADSLFEANTANQGITAESITDAARDAGVNLSEFQTCLDSGEMADRVNADMTNGSTAGVTGTPGTILLTADGEGELISGALPLAQVKTIIDKYVE